MDCHPILALTPKEKKAIALVRDGLSNEEIGARMKIKGKTVADHLYNAMHKLNVRNRLELVLVIDGRLKTDTQIVPAFQNKIKTTKIRFKELRQQGHSIKTIAERLKINLTTAYSWSKEMGLSVRTYKRRSL